MKKTILIYRDQILLITIVVLGFFLRVYHLGFQSFWGDEIVTAIECNPANSWKQLFDILHCCDWFPPLFFTIVKFFMLLFGSNEIVARLPSATAGTISVWAIYLLGKEFYTRQLGLIAAAIFSVTFFNINYSQEARPYAIITLFTIFSFLYLIRFIKTLNRRDCILYSVFTLLMLYTHFFGLFVLVSQVVIGIIFLIFEDHKKQFLVNSGIAGLTIAMGGLPLLYFLGNAAAVRSTWIPPTPKGFAVEYFRAYFGNSALLNPVLLLLLISCLVHILMGLRFESGKLKERPKTVALLVCFTWIFITLLLPYIRSILVVPMLVDRYTIVVLPAYIILLSFGIELIAARPIKYIMIAIFIILSINDILFAKNYYLKATKTQYRELAKFIAEDTASRYPLIIDLRAWHEQYYLKRFGYRGDILDGKKENNIAAILSKNSELQYLTGFWIAGADGEQKMSKKTYAQLDSSFRLVKEQDFVDAWAQLFVARNNNTMVINYQNFPVDQTIEMGMKHFTAIWCIDAVSRPVTIKKGVYNVKVVATGTSVAGIFPHVIFLINNYPMGSYYLDHDSEEKSFEFEAKEDTTATIKIVMDNDLEEKAKHEDRNVFINYIIFIPK